MADKNTPVVAFVGLGSMGLGMAKNLLKHGHKVIGVDPSAPAREAFAAAGGALPALPSLRGDADRVLAALGVDLAITPERVIREGDPTTQIIDVIDKDVDISMLVLAANPGPEGPGPLISMIAQVVTTTSLMPSGPICST